MKHPFFWDSCVNKKVTSYGLGDRSPIPDRGKYLYRCDHVRHTVGVVENFHRSEDDHSRQSRVEIKNSSPIRPRGVVLRHRDKFPILYVSTWASPPLRRIIARRGHTFDKPGLCIKRKWLVQVHLNCTACKEYSTGFKGLISPKHQCIQNGWASSWSRSQLLWI